MTNLEPFKSHSEYIQALIRFNHPLHAEAMRLKRERQKKVLKQRYYDRENLQTYPELHEVIDIRNYNDR